MNCERMRENLHAWLDGELAPREAEEVESHLAGCPECQAQAAAARERDAELRRAFAPDRAAADRLAEKVLAQWDGQIPTPASPSPPAATSWLSLIAAIALGFLLAVAIFQPWRPAAPPIAKDTTESIMPPVATAPPVARVVLATGDVEVHEPGASPWQCAPPAGDPKLFTCPTDSTIKTGPNVCCEVETADGCVIRLNQNTEVQVTSADSVEIRRGQIWCRSPKDVALRVSTPSRPAPPPMPPTKPPRVQGSAWSAACASMSCMTAECDQGLVRVTSSEGEVEVQTAAGRERLARGETAAIADGHIVKSAASDPLMAVSWMQPLLVRKGPGSPEVEQRIEELLANLGSSPDPAYEREIRSWGDLAVPPLARFVRGGQGNPSRGRAMRILADIAPGWAAGDLIDFLADDETEVRILAAGALARLTGFDQGRPAEGWRETAETCQLEIAAWKKWWAGHRAQHPAPTRKNGKLPKIAQ